MNLTNPLGNIFGKANDETEELSDEEIAAQEKAERIAFHRRSVRNGPAKFHHVTSGQIRRAHARDIARQTRKTRRKQVRAFKAQQAEAATLRGHLQAAGVLAYVNPGLTAQGRPEQARRSIIWLVEHYYPAEINETVEVTEDVVRRGIEAAAQRWQTLVGMPVTPLSPAYTLPVRVAG